MEYRIAESVAGSMVTLKQIFIKNALWSVLVILLCIVRYYFHNYQIIDTSLFIAVGSLVLLLGAVQYYTISSKGDIINNTATNVVIENNAITIVTYPFKGLYFINRQAKNIRFNTPGIEIKKVPYPVKQVYSLDENVFKQTFDYRVFKLSAGKNEAYILLDYFDAELEKRINSLKV
jgi:hypothetical protein